MRSMKITTYDLNILTYRKTFSAEGFQREMHDHDHSRWRLLYFRWSIFPHTYAEHAVSSLLASECL